MGEMIVIVMILGVTIGLMGLVVWAIWLHPLMQQGGQPRTSQGVTSRKISPPLQRGSSAPRRSPAEPTRSPVHPIHSGQYKQLLVVLQGDQGAMQRLLTHAKLRKPGRSEQWYIEKVMLDLQRDRRS